MADEWDDDFTPTTKPVSVNPKKYDNNDEWDDTPVTKKPNQNQGYSRSDANKNDDDWNDDPKPTNNSNGWSGGAKKQDDGGWNDEPASNGWNDDSSEKPFGNRSNNDRGPRKADWICDSCQARVYGSRNQCFKCQADKGDSKDAPPDDGSSRRGKANDWICDSCSARVFGSKPNCFKCGADKGDSKDAPPDDGNSSSRGARPSDWICDACGAKVYGSKTTCFKCNADKSESKDAPSDGAGRDSGRDGGQERGPRPGDWTCSCGTSNFASRQECYKCSEAKPEGAGDDPKFNADANKEFYIPNEVQDDELFATGITSGINFSKFNDIPVSVTDNDRKDIPAKCTTFKACGLNDFLLQNVARCNYTTPTPIQQYGIPIIMAHRDLMACAQTGSGKTAAFLLPIIHNLMTDNAPLQIAKPYAVIMTPTRELCTQIYNEARKFAQGSIIKCCQIYGGTASRHQQTNLNNGCHILVATPGRLKDYCDKTYITFENLRYFVLDEADRMLDMGFAPSVEEVMNNPTMVKSCKRRTLMFSATFPNEIQRMAGKYLHEYIFLTIGVVGGASTDVEQIVYEVGKFDKRKKLMEILDAADDVRGTMVFVETKRTADFLASFLSESKHPTTSIHGDRKQSQREEALRDFKTGRMKVIIATSVAARGLDIPDVRHVINYDIPKGIDDYVHRIGRTGRVGNVGKATSFFNVETDAEIAADLQRILKEAKQMVPDFLQQCGGGGGGGAGPSTYGGTDFRTNDKAPPAHGDDEEW